MADGRLLLVEDEGIVREAMAQALARAGYSVDDVETGEEALRKLSQGEYDLLLVDLVLPGMGGLELLTESQRLNKPSGALIITGYGTVGNIVQSMDVGARWILMKPFSYEELVEAVQHAPRNQSMTREKWRLDAYRAMVEISHHVLSGRSLPEVSKKFLECILLGTGASEAALFLSQAGGFSLICSEGLSQAPAVPKEELVQQLEAFLNEIGASLMARGGGFSWPELRPTGNEPAAKICLPLHLSGRIFGLVVVGHGEEDRVFSPSDVQLLWISCALFSAGIEGLNRDIMSVSIN